MEEQTIVQKAGAKMDALISDFWKIMGRRKAGKKTYVPTMFRDLDEFLGGGLGYSHLVVVAGRPAMGKTAFAVQVAEHVAEQNLTTIVFTMEMTRNELLERMIVRRTGVPSIQLKTGKLTPENEEKVRKATEDLESLPIVINDKGYHTVDTISDFVDFVAASLENRKMPPIGAIVIDYIQLMNSEYIGRSRDEQISEFSRSLKNLAMRMNVPVVALSQVERTVEQRDDRRPIMSDLRESAAIEQDANVIIMLYRDEVYHPESVDVNTCEAIIRKNRSGSVGTAFLGFEKSKTNFTNLAERRVSIGG